MKTEEQNAQMAGKETGASYQTINDRYNRQVLTIDDDLYADDEDMMYIIRRLQAAASDPKLRQEMDAEDEYFMAIENRAAAIMERNKIIAGQNTELAENDTHIAERD